MALLIQNPFYLRNLFLKSNNLIFNGFSLRLTFFHRYRFLQLVLPDKNTLPHIAKNAEKDHRDRLAPLRRRGNARFSAEPHRDLKWSYGLARA